MNPGRDCALLCDQSCRVGFELPAESRTEAHETNERLRAMIEAFDGLIYVCSRDYRIEYMNTKLIERTGFDATGEACFKILHGRDSICPWCVNERVFRGETVRWEVQSPKDDRWFYVVNTPIYHLDGSISKQAMILDITERKQAEIALGKSEQKYRILVESSSDAILMFDNRGKIVSFNHAFLELFGYENSEILGQSIKLLYPGEESYLVFEEKIEAITNNGESLTAEWELIRKDRTLFPAEKTISPIDNGDGLTGFVAIIRDVSKRKEAARELEQYREHLENMVVERTCQLENAQKALIEKERQKTVGTLSAEVAHEIRNPLIMIGGFAGRLLKKLPDVKEADIIFTESRRLEKILDRISNYLKPVTMNLREFPLNDALEEAFDLLESEIVLKGINLQLDLRNDLSPVITDPGLLRQVLVNVIRKILQMGSPGGDLNVSTIETDMSLHIDFRLPIEAQEVQDPEFIFSPPTDGTLIVSSLSSRFLDAMNGSISFCRHRDGMSFTISLPKAIEGGSQSHIA